MLRRNPKTSPESRRKLVATIIGVDYEHGSLQDTLEVKVIIHSSHTISRWMITYFYTRLLYCSTTSSQQSNDITTIQSVDVAMSLTIS